MQTKLFWSKLLWFGIDVASIQNNIYKKTFISQFLLSGLRKIVTSVCKCLQMTTGVLPNTEKHVLERTGLVFRQFAVLL